MLDFDLSADIQALRSTFADIKAVVDVEALTAEIARLSEEAGAPDLWDDTGVRFNEGGGTMRWEYLLLTARRA